ncbi:MlaD family protein [Paraconexibacter sp.]|uniref:MlaD family protein n=1 Tax=Paraconexibacter sp. TaxID=2949640 RepID=UPI0035617D4C
MKTRTTQTRALVAVALAAAVTACAVVLLGGGDYTIRAQFTNAGGLVKGGLVQVAGRKVGSISDIRVSDDGRADVVLEISDGEVTPLREGTRATIRSLGQAGITNRFVALSPGSGSGAELPDGSVLPVERTTSVVALDAIVDSFGPKERANLKQLVASSAEIFAGSGGRRFNAMLGKLDPALAELNGMVGELARDRASVRQVITAGHTTARAIASRREDLRSAVAGTATALGAVAQERRALGEVLDRTPAVLAQAQGTLKGADGAVVALRPALRKAVPVAEPLDGLLARSARVLPRAAPVVARLADQLPSVRRSLAGLRPLRTPAVKALTSARTALDDVRPIVRGARFYGSDFVLGILNGLVGAGGFNYTRAGHYERLDFIQPPQTSIGGFGSTLFQNGELIPGIIDIRTKQTRRCPGGNVPPAIDGSSPWVPDADLCSPEHSTPASVNDP